LSRIWGGIHPPVDDIPGRLIGIEVAIETWNKVNTYFAETLSSVADYPVVKDGYSISPNPVLSGHELTIKSYLEDDGYDLRVRIFDINGRLVKSEIVRPQTWKAYSQVLTWFISITQK